MYYFLTYHDENIYNTIAHFVHSVTVCFIRGYPIVTSRLYGLPDELLDCIWYTNGFPY